MLRSLMTVLIFFFTAVLHGQDLSSLSGKILIGERLEFFSILNDTTLHSSINSYTDTANFYLVKDILFIKQKYLQTDRTGTKWIERLYEYKIDKVNGDTLHLKSINDTFNGTDSHLLVNIERLKENVEDFKFLRLVYVSPWTGRKQITIDSSGIVTYIDSPSMYSINNPGGDKNAQPKSTIGRLTKNEFEKFKVFLSYSLPSRLPLIRGCGMDDERADFEIAIGEKRIKSRGCELSWTHGYLLKYLYNIDKNERLVNVKSRQ